MLLNASPATPIPEEILFKKSAIPIFTRLLKPRVQPLLKIPFPSAQPKSAVNMKSHSPSACRCLLLVFCLFVQSIGFTQPAGSLDLMFDADGVVTSSIGTANAFATTMAIQADGKLLLCGSSNNGIDNDFTITRCLENGMPDPTFDLDGTVQLDINGGDDFPEGIVVRPDNQKIIVGGYSFNGLGFDFSLAQFLPDGSPDPEFGNNGKTFEPLGTTAFAKGIALQKDGKIIIAGYSSQGTNEFTLIRWLEDGSLDFDLDGDGIVTTPIGTNSATASCIIIQPDDKILVAGQAFNDTTFRWEAAVARYHVDGSLDETFEHDGISILANFNKDLFINAIALDQEGKIIAAGYTGTSPSNNQFALMRFLPDGRPDSLFGTNGLLITPVSNQNNQANSILIQSDHKMMVGGTAEVGGVDQFALARYDREGSPDPTFGNDGIVTTSIGLIAGLNSMLFDFTGRIVASGSSLNGTRFQFTAARYINDVATALHDPHIPISDIAIYPNLVRDVFDLQFTLTAEENISVELFDMQGQLVASYLPGSKFQPGPYSWRFELPPSIAGGEYIVRITTDAAQHAVPLFHARP